MNISVKFGPNLFSGYRCRRQRTQSDDKSSPGPKGLKRGGEGGIIFVPCFTLENLLSLLQLLKFIKQSMNKNGNDFTTPFPLPNNTFYTTLISRFL